MTDTTDRAPAHQGDAGVSAEPSEQVQPTTELTELQRQVRDLTDTELGTLLAPYQAKNFSGLLKKVRVLINAALAAQPTTGGELPAPCSEHPELHCLAPANCAMTGLCARRLGDA